MKKSQTIWYDPYDMYHILMTRKLLIQNHLKLTVKSLGNWGQGNNDAFEFELSFNPGELQLDSKWKICWDNPYPPGLSFEDADKARDGLKIDGGTLHWIAGTHRCFVGDEKLTKGIVFVQTYH